MSAINFAIGEEDIATVMRYPWTSIGSDGSGTDPHGAAAKDMIARAPTALLRAYLADMCVSLANNT